MKYPSNRFGLTSARVLTASACLALLVACGSKVIRDRSPFVQINALRLEHHTVVVDIGVRNVNDVVLEVANIELILKVRDLELASIAESRQASIIANGSETLRFETTGNPAGRDSLAELQSGAIGSLPYTLEGSILSVEDNRFLFKGGGHLYPVPGRPGQFR